MSPRTLDQNDYEPAQLKQMREWVAGGMGAEALHQKADDWRKEKEFMAGLAKEVSTHMNTAGASIQGQAGEAMQNSVSPVVLWTDVTSANADAQSNHTREQGEAFSKVQSAIPKQAEDTPVPEENWMGKTWAAVTGGKTDNEAALEANEALRQEAVTAFNGYHSASQGAVGASAVFEAPPERGMQTSVSSTPQQSIGQHDMSVSQSHPPAVTSSAWAGSGHAGVPGGGGVAAPAPDAGVRPPAGSNPVWSQPGTGTMPGRPGLPGGGTGGPGKAAFKGDLLAGGPGAGARAGGGAGAGAGRGAAGGAGGGARGAMGPGGSAGGGSAAGGRPGAAGSGAAGAGGAGGARGGGMGGGMGGGGRGQGQQGEDDAEHQSPDYLKGDQGIFDDDIPAVAPAVLGDWANQGLQR